MKIITSYKSVKISLQRLIAIARPGAFTAVNNSWKQSTMSDKICFIYSGHVTHQIWLLNIDWTKLTNPLGLRNHNKGVLRFLSNRLAVKCHPPLNYFSSFGRSQKRNKTKQNIVLKSNVWFQKISIPPPWRELEIPEGWGVKVPGNSRGDGG